MPYIPDIHHRRSIRLKDYDYRQSGYYFVTICTQGHSNLLGRVTNGQMRCNIFGNIVWQTWIDLPNHNYNTELGEFIVMPDHVHGIVLINDIVHMGNSGAGLEHAPTQKLKFHGLSEIIRQFKTFSARRINQIRHSPGIHVWQRDYYERIIRNENQYRNVVKYIIENPRNWKNDKNKSQKL
jgi:REP element-mobilizing transposase RayT